MLAFLPLAVLLSYPFALWLLLRRFKAACAWALLCTAGGAILGAGILMPNISYSTDDPLAVARIMVNNYLPAAVLGGFFGALLGSVFAGRMPLLLRLGSALLSALCAFLLYLPSVLHLLLA